MPKRAERKACCAGSGPLSETLAASLRPQRYKTSSWAPPLSTARGSPRRATMRPPSGRSSSSPTPRKATRHKARPAPQRGPESDLETGVVPRLEARDGPSHVLAVNEELDEVDCLVEGPPQNWGARSRPLHEAAEAVTPQRGAAWRRRSAGQRHRRGGSPAWRAGGARAQRRERRGLSSASPRTRSARKGLPLSARHTDEHALRERAAIWPRASFGRQL